MEEKVNLEIFQKIYSNSNINRKQGSTATVSDETVFITLYAFCRKCSGSVALFLPYCNVLDKFIALVILLNNFDWLVISFLLSTSVYWNPWDQTNNVYHVLDIYLKWNFIMPWNITCFVPFSILAINDQT